MAEQLTQAEAIAQQRKLAAETVTLDSLKEAEVAAASEKAAVEATGD